MAMGERSVIALVSPAASGRMAVAEALTNICGANIGAIGNVKLSANWMCACGVEGEDAGLYETVQAVGMEFCPSLGVSIPVGKDSLSMRTLWETTNGVEENANAKPQTSALSACRRDEGWLAAASWRASNRLAGAGEAAQGKAEGAAAKPPIPPSALTHLPMADLAAC